ncbi:hypothetical protein SUGI_0696630 [Cryptomeria japonica]|nr:hypothetical protein SUGI_0696630 [Cryptomeria japonica]
MASSSLSPQPKDEYHAFSGIEPQGIRRKVSKSTTLYDVFINHRGPDSKYSLALPLYTSLKELGIRAFLDKEEMELGQSFPSTIETTIHSAAVHIAIFSKRYAESPWCLAELVLMLHGPAKIIPVFYEVEPWALLHIEKGVYADAFIQYQNVSDHKSILSPVRREVERIKPLHVAKHPVALDKLVQDFERRCLYNLVQDFEIHCGRNREEAGKAKMVGIFGMGGVGKTTLSKELFNRKRQQYARACFLFDVREASVRCNLPSLQKKLLKDFFNEDVLPFESIEEGESYIFNCIERSSSLSFLLVLDDIDHLEQLDALSIKHMLEKPGNSLVIITTRDVGILIAEGIDVGYHLKGMDKEDSRQHFTWHAFSQPHPASGYEDLVDHFLGVCGGLPLSLQVLGRHVHARDENYWRLELEKLGGTMHGDIKKSLKISFDALNTEEKQIFMDMACFFVDQLKYIAIRVWKASGWSAENGLQVLKDKCLVDEIEDPIPLLRMHDHLRDLGRQMANELSEPRRLWRPRDLKKLPGIPSWIQLQNMQCLRISNGYFKRLCQHDAEAPSELKKLEIYGTFLEEYPDFLGILTHVEKKVGKEVEKEVSVSQHMSKMKSLVVKTCRRLSGSLPTTSVKETSSCTVPLNGGTKSPLSLLEDLVIREQENIRRIAIDGNYCPSLQYLEISSLRTLIELQFRRVEKLKCLNVSKCEFLRILSVTSDFTKLEELSIAECPMLEEPNLCHLSCTKTIRIENCNMTSVPGIFNFKMLVELNISRCPKLHELCLAHLHCLENLIVKDCDHLKSVTGLSYLLKLVEVSISWCGMLQLDLCLVGFNSLKRIKADRSLKVKCFDLKDCKNMETVSGISFEMIGVVNICGCPELKSFPVICGRRCLEMIIIDRCGKLNHLTLTDCGILKGGSGNFDLDGLSISDCPMLKELPSFGRLIYLEEIRIHRCGSLQNMTLPTSLKRLELNSCLELKSMVGISGLRKLAELKIIRCPELRLELNLSSLKPLEKISIVECLSVYNITLPTTLIELTLQQCRELQFKAGIGHLTKLRDLHIRECPVIEEMAVVCGLSCLERITIDGCGRLNLTDCVILKALRGNLDMGGLQHLWISDCPELEELPCFARLTCLVEIRIFRCRKLQQVTLPRTLKNLQLVACKELKSVSEISRLKNPVELIISQCGQLELELRLEAIDSLQTITFDGFGKIKSFQLNKCQNIKRVSSNFDVEWILICGCHEFEELSIRDWRGLRCVKEINIESCDKLQNITLPVKLTNLIVQRCRHLQGIVGMDDHSKVTELGITECPEIELPFLAELSCLERITIDSCQKLQSILLPMTLIKLTVRRCRELKMVAGTGHLTKLTDMCIGDCPELEELPILAGLSRLEMIAIYSWDKLHNIIQPTTLIKLIVQKLYRGSQISQDLKSCPFVRVLSSRSYQVFPN